MVIRIVFTETFYQIGLRVLLKVQQAIEIFLNHYVAAIGGNRFDKIQFIGGPQFLRDITHSQLNAQISTHLVARTTPTPMNRIKIQRDRIVFFAKRADYNMLAHQPPLSWNQFIFDAESIPKIHFHLFVS